VRILIDEDLDVRLRQYFGDDHHVETVQFSWLEGAEERRFADFRLA
jgi:hypothetical protein